ncbi:MAG: LamG-like jellyroll fold domain-containing protein [Planctomycetota bacterium]
MCKKSIFLVVPVLLLLAGTAPAGKINPASVTDGHIYLFENVGADVPDDSANSLTANLIGSPLVVDGLNGKALQFNGTSDGVHIPDSAIIGNTGTHQNRTVIAIFNCDDVSKSDKQVVFEEGGYTRGLAIYVHDGLAYGAGWNKGGDYDPEWNPGTFISAPIGSNEWHAVAIVLRDGGVGQEDDKFEMWMDGELIGKGPGGELRGHSNDNGIGYAKQNVVFHDGNGDADGHYFEGMVDEIWIINEALTISDLKTLMGEAWPYSYSPVPADGAMLENTWANLSWSPGDLAVSHDVYLGDNLDDVNEATNESETFRGNLTSLFYLTGIFGSAYPEGLVPGTTYFWRIDEVNDAEPNSPWKGDVWSFWIPPLTAYNPGPADGLEYVDPNVTLSWTAGFLAKVHYVYFGDNFDDVNNAAGGSPSPDTTYSPGTLELEKTYYWRIDEFDGTALNKGDVWSFTTIPVIPMTDDPSLVAWWSLNEGTGFTAVDFSGYGHHGAIRGSTFWTEGYDLGTLEFTGPGDFVEMTGYEGITGTNPRTMTAWVRTTTPDRTILSWGVNTAGQKWRMRADATNGLRIEVNGGYHYGVTSIADGQWHHVAVTFEDDGTPDALDTLLYVDGQLDAAADSLDEPIDTSAAGVVRIGESPWHNAPFVGLIDDVRIYDRVLSQQEIQLVMRIDPKLAWQPSPANGSTSDIDNATPLSWMSGDMASQHDVYFGTDKDAVTNADTSDTTGIYRGTQNGTSYTPPEGVEWGGGPYYWRIDQNNTDGTVTKGRVWSFMVADFILIDDFESYDSDENQIWAAWYDGLGFGSPDVPPYFAGNGTGSAVGDETTGSYTEETIVNGGRQSMPLTYDNNKQGFANYSEVELTLTAPRDWSKHDLGELSLWFHGRPASVGSFVEGPAGTYTMTATGADIWNTADEFHYAFKMLTGAGTIIARVESVEQTHVWAKAGVMIRETLDAGSKFAAVYITPTNTDGTATNGCRFQARSETDAGATSDTSVATTEQTAIVAPYWVKLERDIGGNFRGYYSVNGSTWQTMSWNPQFITMSSNVYVGLALTSHDAAATCEAKFSNVTITGNVSGQWTNQDIGIESNAAEPLYVAVSNSAGTPAVVVHDDSNAATIDTWTEWVIPLQDFADQGIVLTDVTSIAIGLGTQGNMTVPGGSGKIYIDDIRLYQPREAAE